MLGLFLQMRKYITQNKDRVFYLESIALENDQYVQQFFYSWLLKLEKKKYPIVKLSIISLFLLILALGFLRFYGDFSPNTKYSPAKYEDGKLVPAENK